MSIPWSIDSPAPSTGAAPAARDRTSNPLLMNGIEQYRKFEKALEKARGKSLLVLLSGHPDPDAIGSALAQSGTPTRSRRLSVLEERYIPAPNAAP